MHLYEPYLFQEFSVSLCGLLDEVPHSPTLLAGHHHPCLPKCHRHLHYSTLHFIQNAGPLDVGEDNAIVTIMRDSSKMHVRYGLQKVSIKRQGYDLTDIAATKKKKKKMVEEMQGH